MDQISVKREILVWSPTNEEMYLEADALDKRIYNPEFPCDEVARRLANALGLRVVVMDTEIATANPEPATKGDKTMTTYNHMLALAFTVSGSTSSDGEDITSDQIKEAIQRRMNDLDSEGELVWKEAVLPPEDTYEE